MSLKDVEAAVCEMVGSRERVRLLAAAGSDAEVPPRCPVLRHPTGAASTSEGLRAGHLTPGAWGYVTIVSMIAHRNKPIRVDADALAEWKRKVGIPLDDGAAANAAVRLAAEWREREAEAHASGMFFLLHALQDGHLPVAALGELEIVVKGTDVRVTAPNGATATLGVNRAHWRATRD